MFIINEDRIVEWPVEVRVPVDGRHETHRFEASFQLIGQEAIDAVYAGGGRDIDLLRRVMRGWRGVRSESADGRGLDLPFTEENRDRVIDIPYARAALIVAFLGCVTGAARKNSPTPPAAGPAAAAANGSAARR